ncbi:MAG: chorismate synthase [Spirochaetes bacterium GWF1_51_8]|nr:MAG: chorismate synthase [Spirochaetes bacterium GWF1_51_8]
MNIIRYETAGESHGKGMLSVLSGMPAGLEIDQTVLDRELARRQGGYGRGQRMKIETDRADIISGVRHGKTIGSPIALMVWNKDYENWKDKVTEPITRPRPGHADLVGAYKYGLTDDIRHVLERSSARETAARVAAGAVAKIFLARFGIEVFSHVVEWGGIKIDTSAMTLAEIRSRAEASPIGSACGGTQEKEITAMIDDYRAKGETMGGVIETVIYPIPPMLGSYQSAPRRLEARLSSEIMSIQAIKGIEIGNGFGLAGTPGSEAHDEIYFDNDKNEYYRKTNRAGGIEGGMTNGCPVIVRAVMKPIPTLMKPLDTADIATGEAAKAVTERSDVTAVAAAGVVIESAAALVIADAFMERYGNDSMEQTTRNFNSDPDQRKFRWKGVNWLDGRIAGK